MSNIRPFLNLLSSYIEVIHCSKCLAVQEVSSGLGGTLILRWARISPEYHSLAGRQSTNVRWNRPLTTPHQISKTTFTVPLSSPLSKPSCWTLSLRLSSLPSSSSHPYHHRHHQFHQYHHSSIIHHNPNRHDPYHKHDDKHPEQALGKTGNSLPARTSSHNLYPAPNHGRSRMSTNPNSHTHSPDKARTSPSPGRWHVRNATFN